MNTPDLINQYYDWLKQKTSWKEINGYTEITTPYLDRHNDYIQIYLCKDKSDWFLTDDGMTINDLEQSGCDLSSPRRKSLLETTINGFGTKLKDGALIISAKPDNFPLKKHNLIQAILAVSDMFYLARSAIESFFFEDVAFWLDHNDIRYTQHVKFSGKTGYDHLFDFVVPKSRKAPERILRSINNPAKDQANALILSWLDTKESRPSDSLAYAILNDKDHNIPNGVSEAFKNYNIEPVLWSRKEEYVQALAA